VVRECDEDPPRNIERDNAKPVRDIPLPTTARRTKTHDEPAVNMPQVEEATGKSFIAKFQSHAKYYKWSEQDRVFQLKKSLTGTAAQALCTGGENATLTELIKLLHSSTGMEASYKLSAGGRNYARDGSSPTNPSRPCARIYDASCT